MDDHRSFQKHRHHEHMKERVSHILGRSEGGSADEKSDRKMIARAFREHDDQLHGGKKTRLKLANGGAAEGEQGRRRLDRGGHRGHKGGGGKGAHVNVIVAPGAGGQPQPHPVPVPVPMAGGPPRPPMPPPGAGIPPPGGMPPGGMPPGVMPPGLGARPGMGPPMMPPGMPPRAAGGRVRRARGGSTMDASMAHGIEKPEMPHMEEGARSALGRAAKMRALGGIKSAVAAGD